MKARHLNAHSTRRAALSVLGSAAAALILPLPAWSQSARILFGYTAVTDFASAFVAAEQGYFTKRNLDVELKFIPINSTIPAAIPSTNTSSCRPKSSRKCRFRRPVRSSPKSSSITGPR